VENLAVLRDHVPASSVDLTVPIRHADRMPIIYGALFKGSVKANARKRRYSKILVMGPSAYQKLAFGL
jgi:hypothetical protein